MKKMIIFLVTMALSIQAQQFATQSDSFMFTGAGQTNQYTFNQFNPALGTLQAVLIDVTELSAETTFRVDNNDPSAGPYFYSPQYVKRVSISDPQTGASAFGEVGYPQTPVVADLLTADDGDAAGPYTGSDSLTSMESSMRNYADVVMITYTNAILLSTFTGNGQSSINVAATRWDETENFSTQNGGQIPSDYDAEYTDSSMTALVRVRYQYAAIPEPGTLSIFALGLLFLRRFTRMG